ncbi:MAG TPA: hypothetical protein VFN14_05465, partial [Candidatus Limnocylindria bacterium]|nr:hypothetical protein [Candidatus Limnocylindria bacterium]
MPLLVAVASAMLLAPVPLPRSTAVAPVRQVPQAVVAAAAPSIAADLLAAPPRWPHLDRFRSRPVSATTARDLAAALARARSQFHVYGAEIAVSWDGERV